MEGCVTALRRTSRTSTAGRTTRRTAQESFLTIGSRASSSTGTIAGKDVAGEALRGAIDLIAKAGGGVVEGYPQDTQGKKTSAKFLYNVTRSLYEQSGFSYDPPKGKNHLRDAPRGFGRQEALTRSRP